MNQYLFFVSTNISIKKANMVIDITIKFALKINKMTNSKIQGNYSFYLVPGKMK